MSQCCLLPRQPVSSYDLCKALVPACKAACEPKFPRCLLFHCARAWRLGCAVCGHTLVLGLVLQKVRLVSAILAGEVSCSPAANHSRAVLAICRCSHHSEGRHFLTRPDGHLAGPGPCIACCSLRRPRCSSFDSPMIVRTFVQGCVRLRYRGRFASIIF